MDFNIPTSCKQTLEKIPPLKPMFFNIPGLYFTHAPTKRSRRQDMHCTFVIDFRGNFCITQVGPEVPPRACRRLQMPIGTHGRL